MTIKNLHRYLLILGLVILYQASSGQSVPMGIYYQAVARDNFGKEIVNTDIDVRFSIIKDNPLGTVVYQELHSDVTTSRYGVFSVVIGTGVPTGGTYGEFAQIDWSQAPHYLKVEVKFDNDFLDMGTMQFLAVPYALYAQKSLEPGPQGPKGDPGDPASDDQTLSFDGSNLAISGGNTVNLSSLDAPLQLSLIGDTLSILGGNKVALTNQIQDLQLDINNKLKITKNTAATEIDLNSFKQSLSYDNTSGILSITGGTSADLSELKTAGIQDIHLTGDLLSIDKNSSSTGVDLSQYKDNTDNQTIAYDGSTHEMSISGGNSVSLGSIIAFRAKKMVSETGLTNVTEYDFIANSVSYNDGSGYNEATGVFTAPESGIYVFNIGYTATGSGDGRELNLYLNGTLYEIIRSGINGGLSFSSSINMKLNSGDNVKMTIKTGLSTESGTGSFSGFRLY